MYVICFFQLLHSYCHVSFGYEGVGRYAGSADFSGPESITEDYTFVGELQDGLSVLNLSSGADTYCHDSSGDRGNHQILLVGGDGHRIELKDTVETAAGGVGSLEVDEPVFVKFIFTT